MANLRRCYHFILLINGQYHPQSGIPAYFIHPCNTATAMRDIAGDRVVEPETYLLVWLGLVGNCIGLNLPSQMFTQNSVYKT